MRSVLWVLIAAAIITSPGLTQCPGPGTVGVAGTNNLTVEGSGGGGSCGAGTTRCLSLGGLVLDLVITGPPGSIVIGAFAGTPACCTLLVDATYSLDLPFATLVLWYNFPFGMGVPGFPLPSTAVNSTGTWALSMAVDVPVGFGGALQFGLVGPAFATGIGTTQAIALTTPTAPMGAPLCPGATPITTLGGTQSDDGTFTYTLIGATGFTFYSTTYTQLFINMNGNVTFCSGDSDFTPTECEFVDDEARIAPAWSDWTPTAGSTQGDVVSVFDDGMTWCVEWLNVRHFGGACTGVGDFNTFAVSGSYVTGDITFMYGPMSRCGPGTCATGAVLTDQLVGISPGYSEISPCVAAPTWGVPAPAGCVPGIAGGMTTPFNNVDLTAGAVVGATAFTPIYEAFVLGAFGPWDLGPSVGGPVTLSFLPTGGVGIGPYFKP